MKNFITFSKYTTNFQSNQTSTCNTIHILKLNNNSKFLAFYIYKTNCQVGYVYFRKTPWYMRCFSKKYVKFIGVLFFKEVLVRLASIAKNYLD